MVERFNIGAIPESAPRHSEITKDVESVYRTLVSPVGSSVATLESKRINEKDYARYFSEAEREGDSQGVEFLKRKFKESSNVSEEVLEGNFFGKVLDGLFYESLKKAFPSENSIQVTSEFDDYLNRTDFIVNPSLNPEKPLYFLVDTTTQVAPDKLREKILPKKDKLPKHTAFREDIKYFSDQNGAIGLKDKPRVVVSVGHKDVAVLCEKFMDKERGNFEDVSALVFLSQVLWQLERQRTYTRENMIKFRDAGVLIGGYDEYISAIQAKIEPLKSLISTNPELKTLIEKLAIQDVVIASFPLESDQVASMDELAAYRKAHAVETSEKTKPVSASIALGGGNPILKLKKKAPPESLDDQMKAS